MTSLKPRSFTPDSKARAVYDRLYRMYRELHDVFGGVAEADLGTLMKRLLALREEATS
jgi:L-ribulokinase